MLKLTCSTLLALALTLHVSASYAQDTPPHDPTPDTSPRDASRTQQPPTTPHQNPPNAPKKKKKKRKKPKRIDCLFLD